MNVYGDHGKTMKLSLRKSTKSIGTNVEQVRKSNSQSRADVLHSPELITLFIFNFWRIGRFKMGVGEPTENNTVRVIDLVCRNGLNDAPPFWDPPYDHLINPFPECVFIREYLLFVLGVIAQAIGRKGK